MSGSFSSLQFVSASNATAAPGQTVTLHFQENQIAVTITLAFTATDCLLSMAVDADQPVIVGLDAGSWDATLQAKSIAAPYYTQKIWYSPAMSRYINTWWNWTGTNAAQRAGTAVQYLPKSDGSLNRLHDDLVLAVSPNVANVFPTITNPASPFRQQLAGRVILDAWDSTFALTTQGLTDLGDYGVTNCVGLIHLWQHFGYDNGLPQHYSANAQEGGDDGLQAAMNTGKANGCLMGVHENYGDYYPNYPGFNASQLSLDSSGTPLKGWLNTGTSIQAFQAKPSLMVSIAGAQSPSIHQLYGTTASFIDGNSAVNYRQDMDAHVPGASTISQWMTSATDLWAFERQTHTGPVFGEGAQHWYYSGLLDGVEAQTGGGDGAMALNQGPTLPLFVDFDLKRIHPLQINHGMGYYNRWSQTAAVTLSLAEQDAYRMQEIAFGHEPFLGDTAWAQVPLAIQESRLIAPVASSYALAQATGIQYGVNGAWTDSSTVIATAAGNGSDNTTQSNPFAEVQVTYDNGLSLVANSAASPLTWNGIVVPQYGWAANGGGVRAYTAQCGTTLCDYAETATTFFANARNQADARNGWNYAIPSVVGISPIFAHQFYLTLNWSVLRAPNPKVSYVAFVHFVNDAQASSANGGIVAQDDHVPTVPTPNWQVGASVNDGPTTVGFPTSVPDGTYSIRVGLFDPSTGQPISVAGQKDDTGRVTIGYVTLSNGGTLIRYSPPPTLADDPRLNAAGSVVDFGKIKTDGMLSIEQMNSQWVLRPFPRNRNFTVLLSKAAFPKPSLVSTDGSKPSVVPMDAGDFWQLPLDGAKFYTWHTP